ncbi:unnamed protein product [Phytomonas sp. EM1]|nr:unnamed protein product [Phytomonas sp. EM1]|eukprot:CCW61127.1 unnamed protein product [Phytomonas sp. isolate EM1]
MSILSNFNVYALMIVPIALMCSGHKIQLRKMGLLAFIMTLLQIQQSILLSSLFPSTWELTNQFVLRGFIFPLMEAMFFYFVLNNARAMQTLGLQDAHSAAPTVATVWCTCYTFFFRFFPWYHTMSRLGLQIQPQVTAFEAFLQLISTLIVCRRVQRCTESPTKVVIYVIFSHFIGAMAVCLLSPSWLFVGDVVRTMLLLVGVALFPMRDLERQRNKWK